MCGMLKPNWDLLSSVVKIITLYETQFHVHAQYKNRETGDIADVYTSAFQAVCVPPESKYTLADLFDEFDGCDWSPEDE